MTRTYDDDIQASLEYALSRLYEGINSRSYRMAWRYAWMLCAMLYYVAKTEKDGG